MSMRSLAKAYLLRVKSHARSLLTLAIALDVAITVLMVVTGLFLPQIFTPITRHALIVLAEKILQVHEVTNRAIEAIVLAVMIPYLSALIAAYAVTAHLLSIIVRDRLNGVFEILLSISDRRSIVTGLTVFSIIAALISYIPLLTISLLVTIPMLLMFNMVSLLYYPVHILLLLIPAVIFSSILSLMLCLLAPKLTRLRVGLLPIQNALSIVGTVPAAIPFLIINIVPTLGPLTVALYTCAACIIAVSVLLLIMPYIIKETELITTE